MMNRAKTILIVTAVLVFTGCASTRLTLNLDLYKEDPSYIIPLTPAKVVSINQGLDLAEIEADKLAQDRSELADQLFDTYESVYAVSTKAVTGKDYDKEELGTLRGYLDAYKGKIEAKSSEIKTLSKQARTELALYLKSLSNRETGNQEKRPDARQDSNAQLVQIRAVDSVRKVSEALIELGGPLETDFEKTLIQNWSIVAKSITEENLEKLIEDGRESKELSDLRSSVSKLEQKIEDLHSKGRRISENISMKLAESTKITTAQPGAFKRSIDTVAEAATAVPISVGLGDRGTAAINELVTSTSLLYSQIDRLQDPSDPVWRIVSSPENESKWNTQFSETYFYAEGNSSVVVVRDTPMSFRVQRGNNNPTSLVQGQLQISRAIGNAAIAVAAASTGVPLTPLPGTKETSSAVEESEATESEVLARRKAAVEKKTAFRAQAVKNLRLNLISLKDALKEIDPEVNREEVRALLSRFESILNAHEAVFKSAK